MSALPPMAGPAAEPVDLGAFAPLPATSVLARQWLALHRAAAAVAAMAGLPVEALSAPVAAFPLTIQAVHGWRRSLAEQGVADLAAVMEPGLTALIAVHARGGDASTPARTLLHEFAAARDALLVLTPDGSTSDAH